LRRITTNAPRCFGELLSESYRAFALSSGSIWIASSKRFICVPVPFSEAVEVVAGQDAVSQVADFRR
jgi:hypothetical protein